MRLSQIVRKAGSQIGKGGEILPGLKPPPVRVPGADESKNPVEVFKAQIENFVSLKKVYRVPKQTEVLIVGGGIVGSFAAYWLKKTAPTLNVTVVERDSTYTSSSTYWSVGGFRQQFSLPENIKMSLFGVEFLKNLKENLKRDENDKIDFDFNLDGYLFLANEKSAPVLASNHRIQLAHEAKVRLYTKDELRNSFKWLNSDDIELGSFGYENEGWIDAKKFLLAVRNKASYLGADFVNGEVVGFETADPSTDPIDVNLPYKPLKRALVDTFDGKVVPISFQTVVNAAGPWASDVAKLAGIGAGKIDGSEPITALSVSLPVEPRKRYIYVFYCENGPILKCPLTIDPSGVFFKGLGLSNYYACGRNQSESQEPTNMDLNAIDYDYFEKELKPVLVKRVPAFADAKLHGAWAGYYEYNTLDQNLIIGRHPIHNNFIFCNGSSGHGLQHSPAIGKAISELIVYDQYKTIDLRRFGFERVLRNQPVKEIDVV